MQIGKKSTQEGQKMPKVRKMLKNRSTNISLKFKMTIFVFFVLLAAFSANFYSFKSFQEEKINAIKNINHEKIKDSFARNVDLHYNEHYSREMVKFMTPDMLRALAYKQREELFLLTHAIFENMKKEDPYLEQVHYHTSDGFSLLRLHSLEFFGDNIANFRPMVAKAHKTKKPLYGFDLGKTSFSYRVFQPIFIENKYVGALEFGISPKKVLDLVTYFNKVDGLLMLKGKNIHTKEKIILHENIRETPVELKGPNEYEFFQSQEIPYGGNGLYGMYVFDIFDHKTPSVSIGKFVFFNDLSSEHEKYLHYSKNIIVQFAILLFILMAMLHFGFKVIVSKLEESYDTLRSYTKLIDEHVITSTTNLGGVITEVSDAFCKISGYSKEELIGKKHSIVRHPDVPQALYKNMWEKIASTQVWSGEIKNRKKDGGTYWVKATISPAYDKGSQHIGYTAIVEDITDKKIIETIAITDGLTNIFNRRYFDEMFPKYVSSAKRHNELVCFLMLDIDYFKQYNDNYGHQKGDVVLVKVAKCIQNSLKRADDYCFRLGGEEFGVLYRGQTEIDACAVASSIKNNIEALGIEHLYSPIANSITVSMGLECRNALKMEDLDAVYKSADALLYTSKQNGRNKITIAP